MILRDSESITSVPPGGRRGPETALSAMRYATAHPLDTLWTVPCPCLCLPASAGRLLAPPHHNPARRSTRCTPSSRRFLGGLTADQATSASAEHHAHLYRLCCSSSAREVSQSSPVPATCPRSGLRRRRRLSVGWTLEGYCFSNKQRRCDRRRGELRADIWGLHSAHCAADWASLLRLATADIRHQQLCDGGDSPQPGRRGGWATLCAVVGFGVSRRSTTTSLCHCRIDRHGIKAWWLSAGQRYPGIWRHPSSIGDDPLNTWASPASERRRPTCVVGVAAARAPKS